MARFLPSLLLALLALAGRADPIRVPVVGDDQHPPYAYLANGKPRGIYVELIQAAFARLPDYQLVLTLMPWKRALRTVEIGEALAVFPPHRFSHARPYLDVYSQAVMNEQPVVLCREQSLGSKPRPRWPEDFADLRFGVSAGVLMGGERFWQMVNSGQITSEAIASIETNLRKLQAGRLDCHINERYTFGWALGALPAINNSPTRLVVAAELPPETGHIAFGRDTAGRYPYKSDLVSRLDEVLLAMRRDGTLARILARYPQIQPLARWPLAIKAGEP